MRWFPIILVVGSVLFFSPAWAEDHKIRVSRLVERLRGTEWTVDKRDAIRWFADSVLPSDAESFFSLLRLTFEPSLPASLPAAMLEHILIPMNPDPLEVQNIVENISPLNNLQRSGAIYLAGIYISRNPASFVPVFELLAKIAATDTDITTRGTALRALFHFRSVLPSAFSASYLHALADSDPTVRDIAEHFFATEPPPTDEGERNRIREALRTGLHPGAPKRILLHWTPFTPEVLESHLALYFEDVDLDEWQNELVTIHALDAEKMLPILIAATNASEPAVRAGAVVALALFFIDNAEAIEAVVARFETETNKKLLPIFSRALGSMLPNALRGRLALLKARQGFFQSALLESISALENDARKRSLAEALAGDLEAGIPDDNQRGHICALIGELGQSSPPILKQLEQISLLDTVPRNRAAAAYSLFNLVPLSVAKFNFFFDHYPSTETSRETESLIFPLMINELRFALTRPDVTIRTYSYHRRTDFEQKLSADIITNVERHPEGVPNAAQWATALENEADSIVKQLARKKTENPSLRARIARFRRMVIELRAQPIDPEACPIKLKKAARPPRPSAYAFIRGFDRSLWRWAKNKWVAEKEK